MAQSLASHFVDRFYSIGSVRRFLWRHWYGLVTRRLRNEDVVFLNYAYEEAPPMAIPLEGGDRAHRGCIQLYHHVASQGSLGGKRVLEVSCGHGGGASYLARTFAPASYVGLDLNAPGIRLCRERHSVPALEFIVGDAERLPFGDGDFDAVVNIEASHCYASFPQFLREVNRVLRPGGELLYADFRFLDDIPTWDQHLAEAPLQIQSMRDISACVLRGMEMNSAKSTSLVRRHLPKFLHKAGDGFAGVKGSGIYNSLKDAGVQYRSYRLTKQLA